MKLHPTVVQKLLYWCTNYGGHDKETKLVEMINSLRVTPYLRMEGDGMVLVDTQQYISERTQRGQPTHDIVPMHFHGSVVKKLMELYNMYSGHSNELKLRNAIQFLDYTPYERKITGDATVLLLTSDYMSVISGQNNRQQ